MSSLQQNASFLTFLGELTSAGAFRLLSVMLQACDWLREDLAELARSCCAPPNGGRSGAIGFFMTCWVCDLKIFNRMRAPRLICRSPCVLPAGGQQLVAKPNPEGAVLVLEDVVLPLRNLSAYLHAMVDRAVPQLGAQASKMTARQID